MDASTIAAFASITVVVTGATGVSTLAIAAAVAGIAAVMALAELSQIRKKEREKRVFLIYGSEDHEVARKLAEELKTAGYHPWLDEDEVVPGQALKSTIEQAIRNSNAAVVLLSKHLQESPWALRELRTAFETMASAAEGVSPIIPARLDESPTPPELEGVAWADLRRSDGVERLLRGVAAATSA